MRPPGELPATVGQAVGARERVALSPRFDKALTYAARLHADQFRKGTPTPYVSHLLGTAAIALEHGADEEEAIAALLVRLVPASDKLHNARAILSDLLRIGEPLWERFREPKKEGTLWYYRTLVTALGEANSTSATDPLEAASGVVDPRLVALVEELDRVVAEIEREARVDRNDV